MTPTEAGVREYCANTREKGYLRNSKSKSIKHRRGIGKNATLQRFVTGITKSRIILSNYCSKSYITCYQIH